MVEIEFCDDGRMIKGILLGKYQRPHVEVYSYEKNFLWQTKTIYKRKTLNTPLYVIFIPWKHREKELVEVDEKYIVNPESVQRDEAWIKKDKFVSKTYDGDIYHAGMKVNDFTGYKFMYDNNSFMINLCLHETRDNLTILYKNMPELLNLDLCNKEK